MDVPFWGFQTVRPLRAYPNWRVNKHHVISHFMTCCNLVIKIWTVSTLLFELFQHKSLFIHVTSCESTASVISINSPCLCSNFKTGRFVVDQAPASAPVPNQKLIHLHSPCLHIVLFFLPCARPLPAPAHYFSDSLHR